MSRIPYTHHNTGMPLVRQTGLNTGKDPYFSHTDPGYSLQKLFAQKLAKRTISFPFQRRATFVSPEFTPLR